ncbi:MAG: hypothetical protein P8074_07230 [Anaerolineales bacterium]
MTIPTVREPSARVFVRSSRRLHYSVESHIVNDSDLTHLEGTSFHLIA